MDDLLAISRNNTSNLPQMALAPKALSDLAKQDEARFPGFI